MDIMNLCIMELGRWLMMEVPSPEEILRSIGSIFASLGISILFLWMGVILLRAMLLFGSKSPKDYLESNSTLLIILIIILVVSYVIWVVISL